MTSCDISVFLCLDFFNIMVTSIIVVIVVVFLVVLRTEAKALHRATSSAHFLSHSVTQAGGFEYVFFSLSLQKY